MPRPMRHRKAPKKPGRMKTRPSLLAKPIKFIIPKGQRRMVEAFLRDLFGTAPPGLTWTQLAERYPERFQEYIEEAA